MQISSPPKIDWYSGDPPACGRYLVTDGEEIGFDSWWEYTKYSETDIRGLLPSDIGHPERFPKATIVRRWSKYENVKWWSPLVISHTLIAKPDPLKKGNPSCLLCHGEGEYKIGGSFGGVGTLVRCYCELK